MFKRFIHLSVCSWLLSMVSHGVQANVTATIDRNQITEYDLLTLTLRVTGDEPGTPDLSLVERDFEIVGQQSQQNSSISIINGQQTRRSYVDHVVTLRPKQLGNLIIPPITVGTERTDAIAISVVAQSKAVRERMQQILFFETLVDRSSVYVQGQLIYTVRLYYADSISGDFPAPPELESSIVEILEDEKRFETIVNNRRYYVLEKQYAIFPQQSGTIELKPETFIGTRGRGGLFSSRERVSAVSEGHRITVKPQPTTFSGRSWLPASAFSGEQEINLPDGLPKVGDPINRVIKLRGIGISESLMPEISLLEPPGARVYVDQPVTDEFSDARGLSAESSITAGIVPTEPGELILEEIRIPWWNTERDREEVIILPGRSIKVLPAALEANPFAQTVETVPASVGAAPDESLLLQLRIWQGLSLFLGLGWLFYFAAKREPGQPEKSVTTAPKSGFELGRLKKACQTNQPEGALASLREWQKDRFPSQLSLAQLTTQFPVLAAPLNQLELHLYGQNAGSNWQGDALLSAVMTIESQRPASKTPSSRLTPALNPG